jgi:hypothetical protein
LKLLDAVEGKEKKKDRLSKRAKKRLFTIWSILIPPVVISFISMYHLVKLFDICDTQTMSYISAFSFEVLSVATIVGISQLQNKKLLWFAIFLLFILQALGNSFYAYVNLDYDLLEKLMSLFGVAESITMGRWISFISGTVFPLTSLTFIKNLSNYIEKRK